MGKTKLASMLAVMGGLAMATAACSKADDANKEPAAAAIVDQAGNAVATGSCSAKPCTAKPCAAKSCAPKPCGAKPCAAKH